MHRFISYRNSCVIFTFNDAAKIFFIHYAKFRNGLRLLFIASNAIDWELMPAGAEQICGDVERLSTVSLQRATKIIYTYKQTNKSNNNLFERRMFRTI